MIVAKKQGPRKSDACFQKCVKTVPSYAEVSQKMHPLPSIVNKETDNEKLKKKYSGISRYFSEKSFKYNSPVNNKCVEMKSPPRGPQQYFPEQFIQQKKLNKPIFSHQKCEKSNQFLKYSLNDKKKHELANLRINNLKETSSTQSAENLGQLKHTPEFLRSKSGKVSMAGEYYHKRLFTPRNNLVRENFKIISKLGEGKFGKVFMVKQIYTGFVLAMKIVEKKKIVKDGLLEQFIRQLKIQSYLNHPNIISLYGFFSDETHFYSLMQLGCDGPLYSIIKSKETLTEQATSFISKNLLEAVQYIHQNRVLHRDMKPQNIVLILGNVKICDFGWAVNKLNPGDFRSTFCGTPIYLSPQILQGNLYNQKVDIWAIGVLAFELLLGTTPFEIFDPSQLHKIVTQQIKFPGKGYSKEFETFIRAILSKNPKQRLCSSKLLQMDFIKKYSEFETCQELCK